LPLIIGGCSDTVTNTNTRDNKFEASETFSFSFSVDDRTELGVLAVAGSVVVDGVADPDSIRVVGAKVVRSDTAEDAEAYLDEIEVQVLANDEEISARTLQPADTDGRNVNVNYSISVPRDFLVTLNQVAGEILVRSIQNDVDLTGSAGEITCEGIEGNARITLVSGKIDAEVSLPLDGELTVGMTAGEMNLAIPRNTSAEFVAGVAAGLVIVRDLPMDVHQASRRLVRGTLGDGRGTVSLGISSGTIRVVGIE